MKIAIGLQPLEWLYPIDWEITLSKMQIIIPVNWLSRYDMPFSAYGPTPPCPSTADSICLRNSSCSASTVFKSGRSDALSFRQNTS